MKRLLWLWPLCFLLSGCFDLSPDGKTLAISGALWPLSSEKSTGQRASPNDHFPPVWLVKTDGSGATKIETKEGEFAGFPTFSPDGKRLALRVDLARVDQKVEWRVFELDLLTSRTFDFGKDRVLSAVWSANSRSFYGIVSPDSLSSETPEKILQIDAESGRRLHEWSLGKLKVRIAREWQSDSRGDLLLLAEQSGRKDIYALSSKGLRALTTTGDVTSFVETDSGERFWIRAPHRDVEQPRSRPSKGIKKREVLPPQLWRFDPVSQRAVGSLFKWRPQQGARGELSFSPDAKSLAYVEVVRTESTQRVRCLLMNPDGTNARELHRGPDETFSYDDLTSDRYTIFPRWARDGKTLALLCGSNRAGSFLLVGDGQGRNLRKLPAPKIP